MANVDADAERKRCDHDARPVFWRPWVGVAVAGALRAVLSAATDAPTPRVWAMVLCIVMFAMAATGVAAYHGMEAVIAYATHFVVCFALGAMVPDNTREFDVGQVAVELSLHFFGKNVPNPSGFLTADANLRAWNFIANTTGFYAGREFTRRVDVV